MTVKIVYPHIGIIDEVDELPDDEEEEKEEYKRKER